MKPILIVNEVKKYYPVQGSGWGKPKEFVKAVDGVSFSVQKGEVLGIVGESGCGKSTLGKVLCHLTPATEGQVIIDGNEITRLSQSQMRPLRKKIQMIFQDPYASLNTRMTIRDIVAEPLEVHKITKTRQETTDRVMDLLSKVGLNGEYALRYPHEFSGGQRQRIGIARAVAVQPDIIIADEPVSALDVSIQSQVLNLLYDLKKDMDLTYIFIAHDLSVVEHFSNRIAVMYLGNIVEIATRDQLFNNPKHPYTQALLSAIPIADPTLKKERIILEGTTPSAINPPQGCKFHTRCAYATEVCKKVPPVETSIENGHTVFCHLYQK